MLQTYENFSAQIHPCRTCKDYRKQGPECVYTCLTANLHLAKIGIRPHIEKPQIPLWQKFPVKPSGGSTTALASYEETQAAVAKLRELKEKYKSSRAVSEATGVTHEYINTLLRQGAKRIGIDKCKGIMEAE